MTAKHVLSSATSEIAAGLETLGYRRAALRLMRRCPSVTSLIELQIARGATSETLSFVVNFGVVVNGLVESGESTRPTYTDCHWAARLLGGDGVERWWPVRDGDSAGILARQLGEALERDVLPALESMQSEDALIALWQTGRSPGLAEEQRLLFLGLLLWRAGRRDEFLRVRTELETEARDSFGLRALAKLMALDC